MLLLLKQDIRLLQVQQLSTALARQAASLVTQERPLLSPARLVGHGRRQLAAVLVDVDLYHKLAIPSLTLQLLLVRALVPPARRVILRKWPGLTPMTFTALHRATGLLSLAVSLLSVQSLWHRLDIRLLVATA